MNKMFRSSKNRVLAGVCAGVADFFGLDVKRVGALLYLILWFVVPEK